MIQSSDDVRRASGAILWRFIKATHPESEAEEDKKKKPEQYRAERKFQRNMMELLGHFNLNLSARDKINALDYLEYKYSADQYRKVYEKLGQYNFAEVSEDFDYEKTQTVKLFYELLKHSKKTTGKDKIISAKLFLENIARNANVLQNARYIDKDGNEYTITPEARKEMFNAMKKSGVEFSEECVDYFERGEECDDYSEYIEESDDYPEYIEECEDCFEQNDDQIDPVTYLRIVMNKMKLAKRSGLKENTEAEALEKLVSLLEKGLREDEKQGKETVLKVAQAYAEAQNGVVFHDQMTIIFKNMVAYYDYSVADVDKLCDALDNRGSDKMQKMIKAIRGEYAEYHLPETSVHAWKTGKGRD